MIKLYQDARITGIHHDTQTERLSLHFESLPAHEFSCVVYFALSGFSTHNIVLDLVEYSVAELPARVAAEFPALSYYMYSGEEWQIFHLTSQAGLNGIVVCATL